MPEELVQLCLDRVARARPGDASPRRRSRPTTGPTTDVSSHSSSAWRRKIASAAARPASVRTSPRPADGSSEAVGRQAAAHLARGLGRHPHVATQLGGGRRAALGAHHAEGEEVLLGGGGDVASRCGAACAQSDVPAGPLPRSSGARQMAPAPATSAARTPRPRPRQAPPTWSRPSDAPAREQDLPRPGAPRPGSRGRRTRRGRSRWDQEQRDDDDDWSTSGRTASDSMHVGAAGAHAVTCAASVPDGIPDRRPADECEQEPPPLVGAEREPEQASWRQPPGERFEVGADSSGAGIVPAAGRGSARRRSPGSGRVAPSS